MEERSPQKLSLPAMARALLATRSRDPERVKRFFVDLRKELQAAHATRRESELARDLPSLEASLPADLWQLHLGDIDPTPVDLAVRWLRMSPPDPVAGQKVVFSAHIANHGTGAAAPFSVQLSIDGSAAGAVTVPRLAPGAATTVTFPAWIATTGHRASVTADARRRISEPVEDDNTIEQSLVVAG